MQAYLNLPQCDAYMVPRICAGCTSLHYINPNVFDTRLDLLFYKTGRYFMDTENTLCILSGQGRCGCHCIASVSSNDFLVGFKTPAANVQF